MYGLQHCVANWTTTQNYMPQLSNQHGSASCYHSKLKALASCKSSLDRLYVKPWQAIALLVHCAFIIEATGKEVFLFWKLVRLNSNNLPVKCDLVVVVRLPRIWIVTPMEFVWFPKIIVVPHTPTSVFYIQPCALMCWRSRSASWSWRCVWPQAQGVVEHQWLLVRFFEAKIGFGGWSVVKCFWYVYLIKSDQIWSNLIKSDQIWSKCVFDQIW
jgi:hypothetical protein